MTSTNQGWEKVSTADHVDNANKCNDDVDTNVPDLPRAITSIQVQVIAPASLPEGYEFDACIGPNQIMKVKVPKGGVEEGQGFTVSVDTMETVNIADPLAADTTSDRSSIPVGHWRDDICDCFRYGIFHAHCACSAFCTLSKSMHTMHIYTCFYIKCMFQLLT